MMQSYDLFAEKATIQAKTSFILRNKSLGSYKMELMRFAQGVLGCFSTKARC